MNGPDLQLALPAQAENVIVVRQAVAGLGEVVGMSAQRIDDLKTVVTEACNNVVLHAYPQDPGPLIVAASSNSDTVEISISDRGHGFQPSAADGEVSLGLGLPLIASLSDSFELRARAEGTTTVIRFSLIPSEAPSGDADRPAPPEQLEVAIEPGELVRPVLARVIGALAARAAFSVDRLSDTMLLGDAVSAHRADDFAAGRIEVSLKDGDGTLNVRVGPLVDGGGERILAQMDLPGEGVSLRALARSTEVTRDRDAKGREAEYLVIEVAG